MKPTGAAILVSRGMKVLQASPADYPCRSATEGFDVQRRPIGLPSLGHDFNHAPIERVAVGPRREVTLTLSVFPDYRPGNPRPAKQSVRVRFGGIENFAEVSAFFAAGPNERSELAWLRYADGRRSKPGCLFFELVFERIDARLVVECSSLQVGVAGE